MKVEWICLSHHNERPSECRIDTIVIHSMWAKEAAEAENQLSVVECIGILDREQVSSHYTIGCQGDLFQHVAEERRAWHAGVSVMPNDGRENVNNFSIGIELIGREGEPFSNKQYEALKTLIGDILERHHIVNYVGHDEIAPGRKFDPGPLFDWNRLLNDLGGKKKLA